MAHTNLLAVMNFEKTICENIEGVDYGSFKLSYTLNETQQITFIVHKTKRNHFEYNMLICENFIIFRDDLYVIKTTSPKAEGNKLWIEVTAYHMMYEFQNHFVEPSRDENAEDIGEKEPEKYTLEAYLKYGFSNQLTRHKFKYQIYGEFNSKIPIELLGNKNGIEYIKDGIELFNYIIYPEKDTIGFYTKEAFNNKQEDKVIRYQHNTDSVSATVSTLDLRTAIKVYGKKYTISETKNYQPIKPPSLSYTSDFQKEKTWGTDKVGGKATCKIDCKFGKETVRYTIKKGSDGGLFTAYIDGEKIAQYSCFAKSASSETIDLIKNVEEGPHTLTFIFDGNDPKHLPPKDKKARYLVGTEKTNVINLIADINGDRKYKAMVDYKSPNVEKYGLRYANSVTNDQIDNVKQLEKYAKAQLQDTPKTELTVNYIGFDSIEPRDTVIFVHEPLNFNTVLKVVSLTRGHPFIKTVDEVSFSNEVKDMVQIQQAINRRFREQDNKIEYQTREMNKLLTKEIITPFTIDTVEEEE